MFMFGFPHPYPMLITKGKRKSPQKDKQAPKFPKEDSSQSSGGPARERKVDQCRGSRAAGTGPPSFHSSDTE